MPTFPSPDSFRLSLAGYSSTPTPSPHPPQKFPCSSPKCQTAKCTGRLSTAAKTVLSFGPLAQFSGLQLLSVPDLPRFSRLFHNIIIIVPSPSHKQPGSLALHHPTSQKRYGLHSLNPPTFCCLPPSIFAMKGSDTVLIDNSIDSTQDSPVWLPSSLGLR